MGTFDLSDKVRKTSPDGKTFLLSSFTDTDGIIGTPDSVVWINIESHTGNVKESWGVAVDSTIWSDKWEQRWFEAFCHHPTWRDQFLDQNNASWTGGALPALPAAVMEKKRTEQVDALLRLGNRANFKHFAALKSGTDAFSKLRGEALFSQLDSTQRPQVETSGLDIEAQAKMARWMLRGLPAELALRKIRTDQEIEQNASQYRRGLRS